MGTHETNDDGAMGLPLVMTGPDSTRVVDDLTKWGVVLGADEHGDFGWFSSSGVYLWVIDKWQLVRDYAPIWTKKDCECNHPTIPPPDWKPHDGTKPGPTTPCRTDAASLSGLQARQRACRVVEAAAWNALLESGLTREQLVLLGAYNDSIHATRKAELDMHYAMFAKGGSL